MTEQRPRKRSLEFGGRTRTWVEVPGGDTGTLILADGRSLAVIDTVYADDRQRILHVLQTDAPPLSLIHI